jgi:uncharacterized protein YxeA
MKKILSTRLSLLFFVILFATGCRKETTKTTALNEEIASQSMGDNSDKGGECRLTEFVYEGGSETFHYNRKGLCDEWNIVGWGAVLKQDYDATGQLKKSRWFEGNELIYTIQFFYKGGKVTKEIWYDGNSGIVSDEVYYTYNRRGQNTRMESFLGDYYTVNTFDAAGNVTAWDFYIGGNLTYSARATFSYKHPFKNPRLAVPGIDNCFPYLNSAALANPFCISSEKQVAYDEDGNPTVLYNYDPRRTTYQHASHNYPSSGTFFDLVTNGWASQTFQYENCGRGGNDDHSDLQRGTPPTAPNANRINPMMLLKRNPAKSMKEQVKEFRKIYLNIQ